MENVLTQDSFKTILNDIFKKIHQELEISSKYGLTQYPEFPKHDSNTFEDLLNLFKIVTSSMMSEEDLVHNIMDLLVVKNNEYSSNNNIFQSFIYGSELTKDNLDKKLSPIDVLNCYKLKHWVWCMTKLKKGEVNKFYSKNMFLEHYIDLINYTIIGYCLQNDFGN
jgi:hypothetical protein